jgi:hypothetical protein
MTNINSKSILYALLFGLIIFLYGCTKTAMVVVSPVLMTGTALMSGEATFDCITSSGEGYKKTALSVELGKCDIGGGGGYTVSCKIEDADLETFQVVGKINNYWWAKDKYSVFRNCTNLGKGVSPIRFRRPTKITDTGIYQAGDYVIWKSHLIKSDLPSSFVQVSKSYFKDNYKVWQIQHDGTITPIVNADPATFKVLWESKILINQQFNSYAIDKNNVFYKADIISNLPNSFEVLEFSDKNKYEKYAYAIDDSHVFLNGQRIPGSDPRSFLFIDNHYSKDNAQVYFDGQLLDGADAKNFKILSKTLSKDLNHVWSEANIIAGADAASFVKAQFEKIFQYEIWTDSIDTYINGKPLKIGPINSFQKFKFNSIGKGGYLLLNKKLFYCDTHCCTQSSEKTYSVKGELRGSYLVFENDAYYAGRMVNVDGNSFTGDYIEETLVKNFPFAFDKSRVYWKGQVVPNALVSTTEIQRYHNGTYHSVKNYYDGEQLYSAYNDALFCGESYSCLENEILSCGND